MAQGVGAACKLSDLPSDDTVSTQAGPLGLEGRDGDAQNPSWLGPVRAGRCELSPPLFSGPLALGNGRYLFLVSYSGSQQRVEVYDLLHCRLHDRSAVLYGKAQRLGARYVFSGTAEGRQSLRIDAHCRLLREQ
ncbi:hypothetical protein [Chitinilyticum piscinae]|nr:hypothetical protein [Chitinilyticum piscinae]